MPLPSSRARARARAVLLLLAVALAGLLAAPPARAGGFQVRVCDATGQNHAFAPFGDMSYAPAFASCTADPLGMKVRNSLVAPGGSPTLAPGWVSGGLRAIAAPGTVIVGLRGDATAWGDPGMVGVEGWRAGIAADNNHGLWCASAFPCALTGPPTPIAVGTEAGAIHLVVYCALGGGCRRDSLRAVATLRNAIIDVRDDAAPSLDPRGALWNAGGWVSGSVGLGASSADGAGVRTLSAEIGGQNFAAREEGCDWYAMAPCPGQSAFDVAADTRRLADGPQTIVLRASDAGGNLAERRSTVRVDNVAPTVATPELQGGTGWRAENRFPVRVQAADGPGGSGVQRMAWEVCRPDGTGCVASSGAPAPSVLVTVPGAGEWKVRFWAQDALRAGPKSGWSETLRYDPVVPGRAAVTTPGGWIGGKGAANPTVELPAEEPRGPSGIAGYAVVAGPSEPDTTIVQRGERAVVDLGELPEGRTRVAARAISGAGVPSADVGAGEIRVDRSPPAVTLQAGDVPLRSREGEWLRRDVHLTVRATDQEGLSGMAPAPDADPVERGGHLEIQVDDGTPRRVRGGAADVTLEDGDHVVTVRATDAAGNTSAPQRATFRVDRAAPAGALRERMAAAPNVLSASVAEDCIADAELEYRRVGDSEAWASRSARLERRAVSAAIPDDTLPAGEYDVRFRVRDCAGNTGLIGGETAGGDGGVRVRLPLRAATVVAAALTGGARRQELALGRPVPLRGQVATPEGRPVTARRVEVQERIGVRDWRVRRVLVTDSAGRVATTLPPGPSRSLRLAVATTDTSLGARSRTLRVAVPAEATIRASRASVRNGQVVRFSGRLLGGHVPAAGRELELQGFNPLKGRWQPVRTQGLRADRHGRWRASYRFTSTVGTTVTYRFRLRIAPRPDHPFADGHSRTVAVTVRG